jgi:OmpA-OmpF porin, OOP family
MVFPIRFAFDRSDVLPPYDLPVEQIAALLGDPRCRGVVAEITGHADYLGPRLYNQALSERRAQKVANLLAAKGVGAERLVVRGVNSNEPLDVRKIREARAKNRRVHITIVN